MMKRLLPPFIIDYYFRYLKSQIWKGNFSSWKEAEAKSIGYDQENILTKVADAAIAVKQGKAVFERDSVLFHEEAFEWPLLSMLFYSWTISGNKLHLVDFGGSLASLYFQHKKLLPSDLDWTVVEQDHFVKLGQQQFEETHLKFAETIAKAGEIKPVNAILLSCLIQYMEDPYQLFNELNTSGAETLIFYNTPFAYADNDIICIQEVNPKIYKASYPCRFIVKENLLKALTNYSLVTTSVSDTVIYHQGQAIPYEGLLLKRNNK